LKELQEKLIQQWGKIDEVEYADFEDEQHIHPHVRPGKQDYEPVIGVSAKHA